jgi:hypothetical protein
MLGRRVNVAALLYLRPLLDEKVKLPPIELLTIH